MNIVHYINNVNFYKEKVMGNKEIQEQRMKGYFIQAAKEILSGEGLRNISVRNIAERAGYSYATLYNYFKDVKDLIFECVRDFQTECEEYVRKETKNNARGKEKIEAIVRAYVKYFVQYPGIFELFFLEKINDIGSKEVTIDLICNFLDRLCAEEWDYCVSKKVYSPKAASIKRKQIIYTTSGLLLLYINRRYPPAYRDFLNTLDEQLDAVSE